MIPTLSLRVTASEYRIDFAKRKEESRIYRYIPTRFYEYNSTSMGERERQIRFGIDVSSR